MTPGTPAPVRREVMVAAPPRRAFELFTRHLGAWWPLARFSVFGEHNSVAFEDDRIVERAADGRESVWGEVTQWEPASSLSFTWHPGNEPDRATRVLVTFTAHSAGTLVSLEHTGWERTTDPFGSATDYGNGWPVVLAAFAESAR